MGNTIRCRAGKVRNLRKNFDSLTNNIIIQLNTINRLLIELEPKE